jgi:hypothetical protein
MAGGSPHSYLQETAARGKLRACHASCGFKGLWGTPAAPVIPLPARKSCGVY